jgi:hypothetical protein
MVWVAGVAGGAGVVVESEPLVPWESAVLMPELVEVRQECERGDETGGEQDGDTRAGRGFPREDGREPGDHDEGEGEGDPGGEA